MGQFVTPSTHLIGYTTIDKGGLDSYLKESGNEDFAKSIEAARAEGLSEGEILCSFYAKLCYASLTIGKNANITRTRDIKDNIIAAQVAAHQSVFEHCSLNFVTRNCSRIFTHEICRHRVGIALSQTSGRYCRLESIDLILDPILLPVAGMVDVHLQDVEKLVYLMECKLGLRKAPDAYHGVPCEATYWTLTEMQIYFGKTLDRPGPSTAEQASKMADLFRWQPDNSFDFTKRKQLTSAIRRIAPNGQANEIGYTLNLRSLRHTVQMRTSRHAEWEIRLVFSQVYHLVKDRFPLLFHGAKVELVNGIEEVSGLKMQPYETTS